MLRFIPFFPMQFRSLEGLSLFGVGNGVRAPSKGFELFLASLGDEASHFRIVVVSEILKWRGSSPLLTLEDHGDEWAEQNDGSGDLGALESYADLYPLTLGAIAYLVMVLNVAEKSMLRKQSSWAAMGTVPVLREGATVDEGLLQRLGQFLQCTEVGVVASRRFRCERCEECVMKVVAPLCVESIAS